MLILKKGKVCPLAAQCPYNETGQCWGAKANRDRDFTCEYIVNGKIVEGGSRISADQTGKMKVILE